MSLPAVKNAWLTTALMGVLLYGINFYVEVTKDDYTLSNGIMTLATISHAALFAFVWKWNTVRTWTFYLVVIPLFLTSSFDMLVTFDTWMMPNSIFLKEYLLAQDLHLRCIVVTVFAFLDGTVNQAIHLAALYRLSSGLSARSLLLVPAMSWAFITLTYTVCALTSGIPLHPLTISFSPSGLVYLVLIPIGVLKMPRNFILKQNKYFAGTQPSPVIPSILLLASALVIIAKALVLAGVRNELLDIVRLNDPLIFLNDVEKNIPFIAVVIWQYVLVSLPLLAISVLHNFKSTKPTLLWEVTVVNFAFLLTGQFIFIAGSFFWRTPANLRVSPTNAIFWIINLLPVVACLAQVALLKPYRSFLAPVKANSKKRS